MKLDKKTIAALLIVFGVALFLFGVFALIGTTSKGRRVGGPCAYTDYAGTAMITKIEMTEKSKKQSEISGGPSYQGYEIWFSFKPDKKIKEGLGHVFEAREHLFLLYNSWYPGPEYIEKYGIETGKTYRCTMKVIKSGTCTPVIFEFAKLKRNDYFETKLNK